MNKKFTIVKLPKISDSRGNLTFIESNCHVPFDIKRVYYLYDMPPEAERGEHAHKKLKQLLFAITGSFDVILDDGFGKETITLSQPYDGLLLENMVWRELCNFSSGAVCVVLASEYYDEDDYYRVYDDFLKAVNVKKNLDI